jgi:hypothetical protein
MVLVCNYGTCITYASCKCMSRILGSYIPRCRIQTSLAKHILLLAQQEPSCINDSWFLTLQHLVDVL